MSESNNIAERDAAAKPVTIRVETPTGILVVIPSLSEEDVFLNLRECLATTHQACHFTCYGFIIVKNGKASGEPVSICQCNHLNRIRTHHNLASQIR